MGFSVAMQAKKLLSIVREATVRCLRGVSFQLAALVSRTMLAVLIVSFLVGRELSLAAEKGDCPGHPDFVACRDFSWKSLSEPENLFWPAYFWYWNGSPTPDVLREQLADMAGHDAPNVCVVPMPHEFRPVTMNTSMDVDYLSPGRCCAGSAISTSSTTTCFPLSPPA